MIRFTVPGLPVAQPRQRHRTIASGVRSFVHNYTPAKDPVNAFKAAVRLCARTATTDPPIVGPVALTLRFFFPRPKSMQWKKRPMPRAFKPSKPDWDNLGKSVCDALTGLLWLDDAQVVSVTIAKYVAGGDEQPRTEIMIHEIGMFAEEGVSGEAVG